MYVQRKNIYKRKDGRWEGRYIKCKSIDKSLYGYVYGRTYEEVEIKIDTAIYKVNQANTHAETFKNVAEHWLNAKIPELKASSISKYKCILRAYLMPQYGNLLLPEITRKDIYMYSRELLASGGTKKTGLEPKTVNSILSVLKNIFFFAKRELLIKTADIKDISVKQPLKPMKILSIYEQQKLSRYLQDNLTSCYLGILLCLYTGMRIGEICALKWKDVFIDDQYLYVHQTMQRIQTDGLNQKTVIMIQSPKSNCSTRKIPIPDDILQLLIPYKSHDDAFLLTGSAHKYIEPRSLENHFKTAVKKCGINNINFHTLRHTFATRCVELGFDIKSLSEILGHASINITLNRYVHPSMELKMRNMNKLSDLLTK